jgi:hypothetical protein
MGDSESETPQTVAARIRATLAHLPPERLIPAPNCGMEYIPRATAFAKLKALAEGARIAVRSSKPIANPWILSASLIWLRFGRFVQKVNIGVDSLPVQGVLAVGAMSGSESRFPKSLIEFQSRFATEAACAKYLFERRWPDGFVCPGCGGGRAWGLKTKPPMNVPPAAGRPR